MILEHVFTYEGYKCCVVLQDAYIPEYRCGYVMLTSFHPYYETDYNAIPVQCHGGLTYSGHKLMDSDFYGWWIGFDCAHAGDTVEKCTLEYCINQCKTIVDQLQEAKE